MDAGELVAGEVVVGDAAVGVEVLAVGPGVEAVDRDDEPQAVGGGDLAAAPRPGQGDLGLVVDQAGVGPGDGLGADVVLLEPGEPASGRRGDVGADQRFQPDVAGLREEHGAEARIEIGDAGVPLADVAELAGEARPGQDLQEDLGEVHAGQPHRHVATQVDQGGLRAKWQGTVEQPHRHVATQVDQAVGLVDLAQGCERHDVAATAAVDRHGGVARQVGGRPPVGVVELSAEAVQFLGRRGRAVQDAADAQPYLLPGRPLQQLGVGIAPAAAGGHEQASVSEAVLDPFQRAERVEAAIAPVLRSDRQPFPGRGQQGPESPAHVGPLPPLDGLEEADRLAECQIGYRVRDICGPGKIIGFPGPIQCDKMAEP